MTNIFDEFQWRGLVYDRTEGLPEVLASKKVTAYIGFDPTSDSLQIGNLLALMGLARLQRFGHHPIALAGGGTGLVGDPAAKVRNANCKAESGSRRTWNTSRYSWRSFLTSRCAATPRVSLTTPTG